ncbi:MAG: hypothetical protein IPI65_06950 [Bacteroidetes bacterium]|nr:hypothetical protein [Bacteroidota bacterium]
MVTLSGKDQVPTKKRSQGISGLSKADDLFWGTDFFKQSSFPTLFKANSTNSRIESAKIAIDKLGELSERSDLSRLQYFFLRSKINFNRESQDLPEWKKYALEFLNFIQTNPILNTSDNNGGAHMMIADHYLHTRKYSKAISYSEKGLDFFIKIAPIKF